MKKTLIIAACIMFLLSGEAIANNWMFGDIFDQNLLITDQGDNVNPCQNDVWNLINADCIFDIGTNDPCLGVLDEIVNIVNNIDNCFDSIDIPFCHFTEHPPCDVPEPASLLLFGLGLIGLAGFRRKLQG